MQPLKPGAKKKKFILIKHELLLHSAWFKWLHVIMLLLYFVSAAKLHCRSEFLPKWSFRLIMLKPIVEIHGSRDFEDLFDYVFTDGISCLRL